MSPYFIYPYEEYEGKNYDLVKNELPWSLASMHSERLSHTIGPKKSILIVASAKKKNQESIYWVYANVEAPTYKECNQTKIYKNITKNITLKQQYSTNL